VPDKNANAGCNPKHARRASKKMEFLMDKHPISREGFAALAKRLRELKEVERPEVLATVQRARELGDLSENADEKTAKDAQRQIDAEIRQVEGIAGNADVIDVAYLSGDAVMFGAVVVAEGGGRRVRYKILSEYESDPSKNIIAITSPIARAFVGRRAGDTCVARLPFGETEYEIIEVSYGRG
jgi:transcription elongation factor GreA